MVDAVLSLSGTVIAWEVGLYNTPITDAIIVRLVNIAHTANPIPTAIGIAVFVTTYAIV
jgi:hypothetical protein